MEEIQIIQLFNERSEKAITELSNEYGVLCKKIADNIFKNKQDSEECVNDAFLGVWNTIPPQKPTSLKAYVLKIVRNQAIKKYHSNTAIKRNSQYDVALDELYETLSCFNNVENEADSLEEKFKVKNNYISVKLTRIRESLKKYLKKEGFDLWKKKIFQKV